jgi:hypothetical protein
MEKTLYDECVEANLELDHHEADLYIKDCTAARALLVKHNNTFDTFISQIDGVVWLDVPFAYLPYWEEKTKV